MVFRKRINGWRGSPFLVPPAMGSFPLSPLVGVSQRLNRLYDAPETEKLTMKDLAPRIQEPGSGTEASDIKMGVLNIAHDGGQ